MRRRELLRTAGFAGVLALAGQPASAAGPPPVAPLGWVPPSLSASDASYAVGAAPAAAGAPESVATGRRFCSLTTDRALLTVAVGSDPAAVRDRLRTLGAERLPDAPVETYGRSTGRRYRVTALAEDAAVIGVGPAPGVVAERVLAVARTGGAATPGGVVADVLDRLGTGRHLSVDVRPANGVAGAGDRIVADGSRSRLRTVVLSDDPARAEAFLPPVDGLDGVVAASTTRRGRATVREATVRTDALRDRLEVAG